MPYKVRFIPAYSSGAGSGALHVQLENVLNEVEATGQADNIQAIPTPVGDWTVIAHYPPEKGKGNAQAKENKDNEAKKEAGNGAGSPDTQKKSRKAGSNT